MSIVTATSTPDVVAGLLVISLIVAVLAFFADLIPVLEFRRQQREWTWLAIVFLGAVFARFSSGSSAFVPIGCLLGAAGLTGLAISHYRR